MGVLSEEEWRTVKDIGIIGSMLIQNQKIETVVAGRLLMPNKSGDSEGGAATVVGAYCPIVDDLEEVFYW